MATMAKSRSNSLWRLTHATINTGSKMMLDSSGSCCCERRMAGERRSAIAARVRDRNPMEVADDLGHRFGRFFRMADKPSKIRGIGGEVLRGL